jgi:type I restriction enzyme S subunit
MITLRPSEKKLVKDILQQHVPNCEVYVFGSRATGKEKKFSDLDLVVNCKKSLTIKKISDLKEAFSNSDLPFRVDIVDLFTVDGEFRAKIMKNAKIFK